MLRVARAKAKKANKARNAISTLLREIKTSITTTEVSDWCQGPVRGKRTSSSSSASPSPPPLAAAFALFLLTRPARAPPNGDVKAKSMCCLYGTYQLNWKQAEYFASTNLLGIQSNDKGRHVDNLLANSDVTLADEDASVVVGFG